MARLPILPLLRPVPGDEVLSSWRTVVQRGLQDVRDRHSGAGTPDLRLHDHGAVPARGSACGESVTGQDTMSR